MIRLFEIQSQGHKRQTVCPHLAACGAEEKQWINSSLPMGNGRRAGPPPGTAVPQEKLWLWPSWGSSLPVSQQQQWYQWAAGNPCPPLLLHDSWHLPANKSYAGDRGQGRPGFTNAPTTHTHTQTGPPQAALVQSPTS